MHCFQKRMIESYKKGTGGRVEPMSPVMPRVITRVGGVYVYAPSARGRLRCTGRSVPFTTRSTRTRLMLAAPCQSRGDVICNNENVSVFRRKK